MRALVRTLALGLAAMAVVMAAGAPTAAQSKRPTIAVLAFDYGTVQHWWSGTWDIGEGISDMIVDELVNDGSFRVIERKRLDAILAEQNFSNSERADPSAKTMAQIGKVLGVQYLVVGSVTNSVPSRATRTSAAAAMAVPSAWVRSARRKGKPTSRSRRGSSTSRPPRSWRAPRVTARRSGVASCSAAAVVVVAVADSAGCRSAHPTSATPSSARRLRWPSRPRPRNSSRPRAASNSTVDTRESAVASPSRLPTMVT